MTTPTVGPIIGKVTHDAARVLLEFKHETEVTCVAQGENGHEVTAEALFPAKRPSALVLEGLNPDTRYQLDFRGIETVSSAVRTFAEEPSAVTLGAVSCNKGRGEQCWRDLRMRYLPHLHLLLHLGDQVYADEVFSNALHVGQSDEKILKAYRFLYRRNWSQPEIRRVLANVSNLMIWDDHEITDDWGNKRRHRRGSESRHFRVGELGRQVFREYQRQLWDPAATNEPADGLEDHMHRWGAFGVLFVDQRGGRSFGYDERRPYLSELQWERIHTALRPGGMFDGCRALVVVTSVPLAYLGDATTTIGRAIVNDLEDHWAYYRHKKEQIEMIRLLRRWKADSPGNRELLVLGGDVHIGCETEIRHQGNTQFRQLITSPIGRKNTNQFFFWSLRALLEAEQQLGQRYGFEHSGYVRKRNYGIIVARGIDEGTPHLDGSLVEAE